MTFSLNELQELGLYVQGELSDLVQKEGAVVGQLDFADLAAGGGPGKGPLLVAEELRLDQILVEDGAVDLDKGPLAAVAQAVDGFWR